MESQSFTYTALPQGRFFRLLKIHPGIISDDLVCEIFACDLETNPAYTALSYVWGDSAKSARLTCSGHICNINQSLFEGLRRIRKSDEAQIAWADAICINQKDQGEKGHQVDLMGLIYDKARDILVWLGPDQNDTSKEAFRCLRTINEKIDTGTDKEWYVPAKQELPPHPVAVWSEDSGKIEIPPPAARRSILDLILGSRGKYCVGELFGLPWFSRVWVLQEVGLATTTTAFWGDDSIDFSEIAVFVYNVFYSVELKEFLGPELSESLAGSPLYALWNVWSTYGKENSWVRRTPKLRAFADRMAAQCDIDFNFVLEASRYFNATNKLDHVYAFLGHPQATKPGTSQTWLQADYSLSLKNQHRLLASSMSQDSLNFLVQAQQTEESLNAAAYPSWVPRWDERDPMHAEAFWEFWDASLRKSQRRPFRAETRGDRLSVSGLIVDVVDQLTPTMKKADLEPIYEAGGRLVEKCWAIAKQNPNPYKSNSMVEVFASTLLCLSKPRETDSQGSYSVIQQFGGFCTIANINLIEELESAGNWFPFDGREAARSFAQEFRWNARNRRFFNTQANGLWGLGPAAMQSGDVCVVLFGADVPFVLRPTGTTGEYKVVGECYILDLMYGRFVSWWDEGKARLIEENIILV